MKPHSESRRISSDGVELPTHTPSFHFPLLVDGQNPQVVMGMSILREDS